MKKIGIVSCYFQYNYGSVLQAYATQMILDRLGLENETINISGLKCEIELAKVKYFIKASLTTDIFRYKMGMLKSKLKLKFLKNEYTTAAKIRNEKFDTFSEKYFRMSQVFTSRTELSEQSRNIYSAVLVGSDQLWLPANIDADFYTLSFVPKEINSIAYATSFGMAMLPKNTMLKASVFLKQIRHIGVREESGQKLIELLTGRKVPVVCDPTLLLCEEEWTSIQMKEPIIKGAYILCYFLGNNPQHRIFARKLKENTNYKIIALPHLDEFVKCDECYSDKKLYDIDPADFLNLIRNATYVCTDSFHCSVFSILYKKNFFTFKRYASTTAQSTNSRIDTLFNSLGITGHIMSGFEDVSKCINFDFNYDIIHKNLEKRRKQSYGYLLNALKDERSTDCD